MLAAAVAAAEWRLCRVAAGRCDLCEAPLVECEAWRHWRGDVLSCFDFTACVPCADRLVEEGR